MNLSDHFTLEEMTFSQTAVRNEINNTPNADQLNSLQQLCTYVLEPLREMIGSIRISSGFRCAKVNSLIGGAPTSQHCQGKAADIRPLNLDLKLSFDRLIESTIPFDQAIYEFGHWIHVSWDKVPRRQVLVATKENSKTVYKRIEKIGDLT